ncbi:MAG TPA: SMP-30/gluconolactonase/LRE family protein [Burkholderiales bacterium]|nr:SMP-30/gluconolactonase/LRE family protein [Burkholderiales bacterium]
MSWTFERVAGPYPGITGGIAWTGSAVLFSAVKEERILRFDPARGTVDDFRRYTGRTNGIAAGADGSVFGAQEGGRRVIQFLPDGSTAAISETLDGKYHNQPTDICTDSRGRVWFADAHNGTPPYGPPVFPFLDHASVLRLERDGAGAWTLVRVTHDTRNARALLLSADEATLYVAEGDVERDGPRELRAYPVRPDGSAGPGRVLHAFGAGERGVEGMCLDNSGNIVACAGWKASGPGPLVYVFAPDGKLLEQHPAPADLPMRCAFGGAGLAELYLTAGDGALYRSKDSGRRGVERHTAAR